MADAPDPVLAERVNAAIERLLVSDASLFDHNVNERSISHRLAVYLEREFGGEQWDVDCEYNRDGHEPKRLHLRSDSVGTDDVNGNTVYPDIIVHCRGTSKNHLAIEMKKDNGGPSSRDLEKLTAFRRQLGYAFALFLRFGVGQVHPTLVEAQWVA